MLVTFYNIFSIMSVCYFFSDSKSGFPESHDRNRKRNLYRIEPRMKQRNSLPHLFACSRWLSTGPFDSFQRNTQYLRTIKNDPLISLSLSLILFVCQRCCGNPRYTISRVVLHVVPRTIAPQILPIDFPRVYTSPRVNWPVIR